MASQNRISETVQEEEVSSTQQIAAPKQQLTRQQKIIGITRIVFGVAWAVAAFLKWQPAFIISFADNVSGAQAGQPAIISAWITLWSNLVKTDPTLFGYLAALTESILAICFILGIFTNTACVLSMCWAFFVWSVAEGFGGPFVSGQSTDIGTAFPYIIISVLLLVVHSGFYLGLDRQLTARLGRYSFLASGSGTRHSGS